MTDPLRPEEPTRAGPTTRPEPDGPGHTAPASEASPTVTHVASTEPAGPEPPGAAEGLAPPGGPEDIGWLGPYRILEVLGSGGMGVVYRAEDPQLRRSIALKTMRPALAAVEANRFRFLREARSVAALEHDHIIPIYHVGEDRGVPFIAMPLLKGETLDDRLRREPRPTVDEALRIGREVAEGLAAAHDGGLVHRDIKPANIWLEAPRGRVRILDFGLARSQEDLQSLTSIGAILGTPAFMSPEQASGSPIDHRSDLFSLGCVLYRLATGSSPFRGSGAFAVLASVMTYHPRPPSEIDPSVPPGFSALILRLLAKDPALRPASARSVARAIAEIEGAAPPADVRPAPEPPPKFGRPARTTPRRRAVLGCGLVAFGLLAVLGGGGYLLATRAIPWIWAGLKDLIEQERGWDELAQSWRPPPDDDAGRIFPQAVGGFRRSLLDADADLPELGLRQLSGRHAAYVEGTNRVDLVQLRATDPEKEGLYARALETLHAPGAKPAYQAIIGSARSRRLSYRIGYPDRRGVLWCGKGWLFVARVEGGGDPEAFLKTYLAAVGAGDRPP